MRRLPCARMRSFRVQPDQDQSSEINRIYCTNESDESLCRVDLWIPLMHDNPGVLGPLILIRIIPKENTFFHPAVARA